MNAGIHDDPELSEKEKLTVDFVHKAQEHIFNVHNEHTYSPVNFLREMVTRGCSECGELIKEWETIKAKV